MPDVDELHSVRIETQDLSADDLTLDADRGESIEILGRGVVGGNKTDDVEESVDETTMLQYWGADGRPGLFEAELLALEHKDILGMLRRRGAVLPTIKVPPGTQYQLNNVADNGTGHVVYRDYNTERFGREDPGAPQSRDRVFITRGREQVTVSQNSTEQHDVVTSANTGGVNDFPWEEDVPQNREYDVVAIAVHAREEPAGGGSLTLDNFRLTSEEQDFLARSSAFVSDAFADYPDKDPMTRFPFYWGDWYEGEVDPLTFSPGDDLTVTLEVTETTNNADVDADLLPTIIARERRV